MHPKTSTIPSQSTMQADMLSRIAVVVPAQNEEENIEAFLKELADELRRSVYVSCNACKDRTADIARMNGAKVLETQESGYGLACLNAMRELETMDPRPEVVLFMDADLSDDPKYILDLVQPIFEDGQDFVLGSRVLGNAERGALSIPQRFGNWLSTRLMRLFMRARYTDLGPFRAIRTQSLFALDMQDQNYGWTIEMQIKAHRQGLRTIEIPVDYRCRHAGRSKVSGTIKGVFGAGFKILRTIFKYL